MGSDFYFWATVLITFLATVVGGKVSRMRKKNNNNKKKATPPGPKKLHVIGNLHQLMAKSHQSMGPHRRLGELAQQHGPVMALQLGQVPHVVISSAAAAEQVMKTHDAVFASRPSSLTGHILFYGSKDLFFSPYGDHWRQMRKLCTLELLTARRVASFRSIRAEELSRLVSALSAAAAATAEGRIVDLKTMLLSLTNTITFRSAFGMASPKLTEEFVSVVDRITGAIGGFKLSDLFPSVKFLPVVTGLQSRLAAIRRAVDGVLDEVIGQHVEARRRRQEVRSSSSATEETTEDLVDVLLNLQQEGTGGGGGAAADSVHQYLTMDAIKAILLNMFLGGTESAALTVEWVMSQMMKNPSVMQRAQKEVRSVFRDNVDEERLHQLEYLHAVIKETFRLQPPSPLLSPKLTGENVEIGGFEVSTKSRVLVNVWAIGRDPQYWTEPERFYPERFLNSPIDYKGTHFGLIPFAAGRRMCPGIQFGMTIVQFTLANLLFHFDWKLPRGVEPESLDMTEIFDTALRRKEKLCLVPVIPARAASK
ncbi:unnamed protein product [Linum tenue]|uniref:Cytochrome P450 n=1 Tax=Linum tenue TaxID=586396 RepID=A0AAV0M569_9ROSI|nr:unnamed protein product [Linum tenue]